MGKIVKTAKEDIAKDQTKTDLQLAVNVSDRIELESVRLMSCSCKQYWLTGPGKKGFEIKRTTGSSVDKGTNRVFVLAQFTLNTFEDIVSNKSKDPFAVIEASFLLMYQADTLEGITQKSVEQFGKLNGMYNAWPYWREFVQNTTIRMGLPPLTIPVFRIFAPKKAEAPKKKVVPKKKTSAKRKTTKANKLKKK